LKGTHVEGRQSANLLLYTLSTCGWCRKTKDLLKELGVAYDYIDVDQLGKDEYEEAVAEITKWNPMCSFPTIVVNGKDCIVGFKEQEIREVVATQ
jgi:glutaredoxin